MYMFLDNDHTVTVIKLCPIQIVATKFKPEASMSLYPLPNNYIL